MPTASDVGSSRRSASPTFMSRRAGAERGLQTAKKKAEPQRALRHRNAFWLLQH